MSSFSEGENIRDDLTTPKNHAACADLRAVRPIAAASCSSVVSNDLPHGIPEILQYLAQMARGYDNYLRWNEVAKLKADLMNVRARWLGVSVSEIADCSSNVHLGPGVTIYARGRCRAPRRAAVAVCCPPSGTPRWPDRSGAAGAAVGPGLGAGTSSSPRRHCGDHSRGGDHSAIHLVAYVGGIPQCHQAH